jgi:Mn2+/Fe2+ NRAMP family transporter
MIVMMLMVMQPKVMGQFTLSRSLQAMGWLSTAVMAVTVVAMLVTMAL